MRNFGFSILVLILFFLLLEGIFRIYLAYKPDDLHQTEDNILGWKVTPNIQLKLNQEGIGEVFFTTSKYGFRKWGNTKSTKKKICIVGDSYTEALQVSDGLAYYDYIDTAKYELFVFGCGGYGTLQEFMAVEKVLDTINPDLLLWQFCHNDLINNSLELEKQSRINNYLMWKPYLINDSIIHTTPHQNKVLAIVERYSKIALWTHLKYLNIMWSKYGSIESNFDIKEEKFNKAYNTTKSIFEKIKRKNKSVVIFSVTTSFGYNEVKSISDELSIPFFNRVHETVDSVSYGGVKTNFQPYDWHWNKLGHKLAGEVLNKEINNYFKSKEEKWANDSTVTSAN